MAARARRGRAGQGGRWRQVCARRLARYGAAGPVRRRRQHAGAIRRGSRPPGRGTRVCPVTPGVSIAAPSRVCGDGPRPWASVAPRGGPQTARRQGGRSRVARARHWPPRRWRSWPRRCGPCDAPGSTGCAARARRRRGGTASAVLFARFGTFCWHWQRPGLMMPGSLRIEGSRWAGWAMGRTGNDTESMVKTLVTRGFNSRWGHSRNPL